MLYLLLIGKHIIKYNNIIYILGTYKSWSTFNKIEFFQYWNLI